MALTKNARLAEVDRLSQEGMTQREIAGKLGISERQVKRDVADNKAGGKLTKRDISRQIVTDDRARDAVLGDYEGTMAEIRWAIKQLRDNLEAINSAVLEKVHDGEIDGVLLSSWAKVYDSLTNQLTLKAKVAGEITDAPQLSIVQIDRDVEDVIQILSDFSNCPHCGAELHVGRFLYNRLLGKYPRRRGRFKEYFQLLGAIDAGEVPDFTEGEFKEVPFNAGEGTEDFAITEE